MFMNVRSVFLRSLRVLLLVWVGFVVLLVLVQERLLYHPRPLPGDVPPGVVAITRDTGDGTQRAWWRPPVAGGAPRRLWVCTGGNGALAWDWLPVVEAGDARDGFLLIDYPGYGGSAGSPTPAGIDAGVDAAVAAVQQEHPGAPLCVLGHSLGCAPALRLAGRQAVQRIVLIAPFTSVVDMARRLVGWPACYLARHRWDNRAALAAVRGTPAVDVIHGDADQTIPVAMGEALAAGRAGARFHLVSGGGHDDVVVSAAVVAALRRL
jgi:uncharacterized protein